jgi:hypothetical protein
VLIDMLSMRSTLLACLSCRATFEIRHEHGGIKMSGRYNSSFYSMGSMLLRTGVTTKNIAISTSLTSPPPSTTLTEIESAFELLARSGKYDKSVDKYVHSRQEDISVHARRC